MLQLDPETRRKNMIWALSLAGLFVLLFGGTVVVAFVYLAVAG